MPLDSLSWLVRRAADCSWGHRAHPERVVATLYNVRPTSTGRGAHGGVTDIAHNTDEGCRPARAGQAKGQPSAACNVASFT